MPFQPQSQVWPGRRAVLLVHGVGNAGPGDYTELVKQVQASLGDEAEKTAIYQLWYDQVNDWFAAKTQLGPLLTSAVQTLAGKIDDPELGPTLAEVVGDVLWPVLLADARTAVRETYIAQLQQLVLDGVNAGVPQRRQKLSIICHSLGCFHTYEVLHHIARFPSHALQPGTHEVVFQNVVFMASPVQLIRTVADAMGSLVPNKRWLYTVQGDALSVPFETSLTGVAVRSVKRWVSITGDLDPVGGHFFRRMAPWAYMDVAGEHAIVDDQQALRIGSKQELAQRLLASRRDPQPPLFTAQSPHDWGGYVTRHAADLKQWIAV